ncbi:MAG: cupin domain-containing protein [Robiginitomaculum sp.]|nr:cupin domain-containing protein [Robiginitomaculum sp.]
MSRINYHPPQDMLLGYASGHLQDGFNLVIGSHINMCADCRKTLHLHQSIGGHIVESQSPVPMKSSAESVLNTLKAEPKNPVQDTPLETQSADPIVPFSLQNYVQGSFDALKWQKLSRGLKQHVFKLSGSAKARLIWIDKGVAVPSHGHKGDELTLVLSGGYFDGEQAYTKGDVQWADHRAPHQPIAMMDGPCLTLAVTDAPIIFQNLLPKLLQPFFNI